MALNKPNKIQDEPDHHTNQAIQTWIRFITLAGTVDCEECSLCDWPNVNENTKLHMSEEDQWEYKAIASMANALIERAEEIVERSKPTAGYQLAHHIYMGMQVNGKDPEHCVSLLEKNPAKIFRGDQTRLELTHWVLHESNATKEQRLRALQTLADNISFPGNSGKLKPQDLVDYDEAYNRLSGDIDE